MIRLGAISLAVSVLAGCSTLGIGDKNDFSCANIPDSGHCLPVSQLDVLSENSEGLITQEDVDNEISDREGREESDYAQSVSPQGRVMMPTLDSPVAIMSAPLVLRTYVGPWRSGKTLYGSSYAFTTVKESDFSFGISHEKTSPVNTKLYALQVEEREEAAVADEAQQIIKDTSPQVQQAVELAKDAYLPK